MVTHCCAEVATAWAAMVLDHSGSMGLTEYHERHSARGPHSLPLEDGGVATRQLRGRRGRALRRGHGQSWLSSRLLPPQQAPQPTSPSTLSVAIHLCPALSLMRSILGASMRQLQRGSSSNPRSVSREDVSLDTPWRGRNGGDEGLAPHPPKGSPPSLPAAPSHSRTPKPGMDTPALAGFPSTPVGTP